MLSRGVLATVKISVATSVAMLVTGAVTAGCGATSAPPPPPRPVAMAVAAYVVPWDSRSRADAGGAPLTEISPVWLQPKYDGSVGYASNEVRASVRRVAGDAAAQRRTLAPSISNAGDDQWDGAVVARLIADPARRAAHVSAIVDLVRSMHWPAVDLDYESLPAASRTAYSAFVAELAAALHRLPA